MVTGFAERGVEPLLRVAVKVTDWPMAGAVPKALRVTVVAATLTTLGSATVFVAAALVACAETFPTKSTVRKTMPIVIAKRLFVRM
jgi:ABC-type sulfate transport system permease component